LRLLIKGVGLGLAGAAASFAYWFSTVSNPSYPIFTSLMVVILGLMSAAAILALLY